MKPDHQQIGRRNFRNGRWAEFLARLYFRLHGWKILAKNFKSGRGTHIGEVDFIATRKKILAFVEVKTRTTTESALMAVTDSQKRRLINAATNFSAKHPLPTDYDIRFDLIAVRLPFFLKHIPNAWDDNPSFREKHSL